MIIMIDKAEFSMDNSQRDVLLSLVDHRSKKTWTNSKIVLTPNEKR